MTALIVTFFAAHVAAQLTSTTPSYLEDIGYSKTCSSGNSCSYNSYKCSSSSCSLTCSGYNSCNNLELMAKDTTTIDIYCEYNNACDNMIIHGENSGTLTFTSNGYESDGVTIYANDTSTLYLNCRGKYSCKNFFVVSSGSRYQEVYLDAAFDSAFYYSTLNVSKANYVSVKCSSESFDNACYNSYWYLPNYGDSTYIYCYGYGCNYFGDIYVDNSVERLSVEINGCNGECSSKSLCISLWNIHCSNSYPNTWTDTDNYYGDYCSSALNDCSCDIMENSIYFNDYNDEACVSGNNEKPIADYDTSSSSSIAAVMGSMVGIFICIFIVMVVVCVIIRAQRRSRSNYTAPTRGIQPAQHVPVVTQKPMQVQQPMQMQQQPRVIYMQQPMQVQQQGGQNMQPRIVYVQAAPQQQGGQNIQGAPQNVQSVTPMQPAPQYSTNNNVTPMQVTQPQYNPSAPSVPSAPSAPGQDAPPAYDDAPPAYNNVGPGNNAEGGVTNY